MKYHQNQSATLRSTRASFGSISMYRTGFPGWRSVHKHNPDTQDLLSQREPGEGNGLLDSHIVTPAPTIKLAISAYSHTVTALVSATSESL